MTTATTQNAGEAPRHPQAKKALTLLTIVNYLNYIDRFILSAVLLSIKTELNLSDFQAGLLATAFMIAYMFTSPLFGWMGDTKKRTWLLAGGALLWSVASLMTGWAGSFIILAFSRFILGFGESAFTTVATPFISDYYPSSRRGRALAIFSSGLPVGAALGFVFGGLLGQWVGWRNAFMIVGFPGIVLAGLILTLPDPKRKGPVLDFNYKKIVKDLSKIKSYVWTTLGYCAYSFVVGGIAHWVPTYLQRAYSLDQMKANMLFGGIAVGSGLVGTLLGGSIGDYWSAKNGPGGHLKISAISMALSLPFFVGTLYAPNINWLIFCLVFTQLFFFLSTSPISVALLEAVPSHSQTTAMAMSIFLCHILGDAISSPIIGLISDRTGSLQTGMSICIPVILISSICWVKGMKNRIVLQ
jgi:predicted MFS family arabinose efflux permease